MLMAATVSFSFCINPPHHHHQPFSLFKPYHTLSTSISPKPAHPLLLVHKLDTCKFRPSFSSSSSHSSSESSSSPSLPPPASYSAESYLNDLQRTGRFLINDELKQLQVLQSFRYSYELDTGSLSVRVMDAQEMDATVGLLSESFAESMALPFRYVRLLAFLVKQYMIERRALMPHTATLIGYYRGESGEEELVGTVEVSFNKRGANASPPTPTPPKDSPYICNMTVKKPLRRRGIGWHLLKACEELISQITSSREVYLHCRMIDTAPFNMYTKAGYNIIKTDNLLILLTLQRRKHLMCKKLPVTNTQSELGITSSNEESTS
ncbi:PREDICTED: uncharacterized protein LOC104607924 [Nelumbo nucifera]|uniref:Uncharacterized protein LOC104607924 n=2 Tax=Nelumbo nucifera TaxID=4432 RepID=A0A1U8QAJ2_NELNU|nr:PREDICTED: uncharacterized protein LOC104607924 [Nelumbo nucifera]XP_019055100.1 PREDICTED: uncharacterized protein LOC104607924 [Nelumbo nucifera]DAD31017.1 TPA_asm: hypothetical protein HUJ06_009868 [Nelumbo nucifera]